jgi:hypothetical protein
MEGDRSVKQKVSQIDEMIRNAQKELRDYKKLTENYRAEVNNMDSTITTFVDDTPKSILPPINELMIDLQEEMRTQKTTNDHFQKQITGLKKEKGGLQQHLISSNTRA